MLHSHMRKLCTEKDCNISNFIKLKRITSQFNSRCWSRQQSISEKNASVSNLGTLSEKFINVPLVDVSTVLILKSIMIVQSYGDFVLMCLPNNLWFSVKSGYSRERLFASGYGNDILAVGFFEEFEEFTSQVRIRNMMKSWFSVSVSSDVPVTLNR